MGTAFALGDVPLRRDPGFELSGNLAYLPNSAIAGGRAARHLFAHHRLGQQPGGFPDRAADLPAEPWVRIHGRSRPGTAAELGDGGGPALRTASLVVRDKLDVTDQLRLDYGFGLQSISFLQKYNYASPFARGDLRFGEARVGPVGL